MERCFPGLGISFVFLTLPVSKEAVGGGGRQGSTIGPLLLSMYLLISWLLIKNIYGNYTEYLRSVFIINGNRFLSLTKINLVIYSNSRFHVLLPGTSLHV